MPRILNKNNNNITFINYNPSIENLISYYGSDYKNYIQVPDNEKEYIWDGKNVIEKPINVQELIASGISYYQSKALLYRSNKFVLPVNKSDNTIINAEADLQISTLQDWLIIKNKIGATKKANIVNAVTKLNEIIEITEEEILRINTILTEMIDNLTALDVRVSNKIKTADEQLAINVFTMSSEQLDNFALSIMNNAESILQMSDEEFDQYIVDLVNDIKGV